MQNKVKTISFQGQNIFIGIDVHLKSWKVTIMLDHSVHKTFSQDPEPKILYEYLRRNFPDGNYYSAYEAGFCGFSVHRELEKYGINNMVVNPADVPTTDKERKQKEDKRDSRKIARSLRNHELNAIYIPEKEMDELRCLIRYRKTLIKDIGRNKSRVKFFLYYHGIPIPSELDSASKHWSARFTTWLKTVETTTIYGSSVMSELITTTEFLRQRLLHVERQIREIAKSSKFSKPIKLLRSLPGFGLVVSITFLSELGTITRFTNLDNLCSFVGLVPTTQSTSDKEKIGNITPRSNRQLRNCIIEAAWIAIMHDPSLALSYNELCKRMKPGKAIIRIAKKLLNRMRYVLKNEKEYVYSIV
jgi:transposase